VDAPTVEQENAIPPVKLAILFHLQVELVFYVTPHALPVVVHNKEQTSAIQHANLITCCILTILAWPVMLTALLDVPTKDPENVILHVLPIMCGTQTLTTVMRVILTARQDAPYRKLVNVTPCASLGMC
jgi:hypothetical protein